MRKLACATRCDDSGCRPRTSCTALARRPINGRSAPPACTSRTCGNVSLTGAQISVYIAHATEIFVPVCELWPDRACVRKAGAYHALLLEGHQLNEIIRYSVIQVVRPKLEHVSTVASRSLLKRIKRARAQSNTVLQEPCL